MEKRFEYDIAYKEYQKIEKYLRENNYDFQVTGSLRRKKDTVGDIDIVVNANEDEIYNYIEKYDEVISKIDNKGNFLLQSGIILQIISDNNNYKYTVWSSTGSKEHVKNIKDIYLKKGIQINKKNFSEEEIYAKIDYTYIKPIQRID